MMRLVNFLLLIAVPILGVWTFIDAPNHGWWFPGGESVSTFGPHIDHLFNLILWMVGITFVVTEVLLAWFCLRYSGSGVHKGVFTHGSHRLEMVWTAIPAALLLFIAFAQMGTWKEIRFPGSFPSGEEAPYTRAEPIAELWASQFDWRAVYPGRDGVLGTADDLENAFEFVVPEDTDVVFHLRSRDVIHSFFVPQFRLKQDALPGHTIPVWFHALEAGEYDLICAELCGWGHYKMAGRVTVLPKPEYDAWLAGLEDAWFTNGQEEAQ